MVLISCEFCNRFQSLDDGLKQCPFNDVYKSIPSTDVTENTELLHGLYHQCNRFALLVID